MTAWTLADLDRWIEEHGPEATFADVPVAKRCAAHAAAVALFRCVERARRAPSAPSPFPTA